MAAKYQFKIFVTGDNPRSRKATENIRQLFEAGLPGEFELAIIDVLQNPDAAEEYRVLATPTLIRESPEPPKRIIGDMMNMEQIAIALGLSTTPMFKSSEV